MKKLIIPCLYLQAEKAVAGFGQRNLFGDGDVLSVVRQYSEKGADALIVFDFSSEDSEHERAISMIKQICETAQMPVIAAGNIRRMEDVKKLLYAGCGKTVLNFSKDSNVQLLEEVSKRFGREKMVVSLSDYEEYASNKELVETYASEILALDSIDKILGENSTLPVILHTDKTEEGEILSLLSQKNIHGLTGNWISREDTDFQTVKEHCREAGIDVAMYESPIPWAEFKKNGDGLVPVIVQDFKTDEVLMLAYMNEEAYQMTLRSGKMTYYSRSRQEIWIKGLTSGHFQYVKSMKLDCDNDTILAKVDQIGAACHTGSRSCFFQPLMEKEYDDTNPLKVFQDVYDVILDRKANPKEGSYTNYLFEKGIDKILKKVGEECTEIVIAAKNPDKEEIKYEISDFLYHVMVLMVEKGVSWEEITRELARR